VAHPMRTSDDVYRALGRRLGGQPDDVVWRLLEKRSLARRRNSRRRQPSMSCSEKYKERLAILEGGPQARSIKTAAPSFADTGPWSWALSEIMAHEAAKEPYVRAFRNLVLGDELVPEGRGEQLDDQPLSGCASSSRWSRAPTTQPHRGSPGQRLESQLAVEDYVNNQAPPHPSRADYEDRLPLLPRRCAAELVRLGSRHGRARVHL